MIEEENLAMQTRCLSCGVEQYAPNVYLLSHGQSCCYSCGADGVPITIEEYLQKLKARPWVK